MSEPSGDEVFSNRRATDREGFRLIFEACPLAILIADDDGHYVEANSVACQLFGQAREELIGKRVEDFVDRGDLAPIRDRWDEFRKQKAQSGVFPLMRPDGSRRVLRYHAIADYAPGLHVSFLEDITAILAAEDSRRAAETERDRFSRISTDIFCVVDPERRFARVSPAFKTVLGYDEADVLGQDYLGFIHPDDVNIALEARANVDQHGSTKSQQARFRHRDGSYRWLSWSSTNFDGAHYAVGRDITDERALAARREYERSLFETVLRQMPAALAVAEAPGGKILLTNDKFAQVLRHPELPAEQIAEYSAHRGFHPDGRLYEGTDWPMARSLLEGEVIQEQETDYVFGDDSKGVITTNAAPIRNAQGEIIAAVAIFRDITEQKEARRALERSEARFRTLADGLPLVVWTGDAAGKTQYFNRRWFEYTGLPARPEGSPDLESWTQIMHPEDFEHLLPVLRERRARGEEIEATYRLRRHDGTYRWHLARSIPIRDDSGRVVRWLGSVTDIEDQRRAIESLQLERDLRERFVAALSHDLRSPLTAVKMGAQLILRRAEQPEFVQSQASRIVRNVEHADRLIQNLLDVSRLSAGESLAIERAPCDLTALLRDILADQTTVYGDRFKLEAQASVSGLCDQAAVRRTMENLLGNAIKYGDPHARVRVSVSESNGEIRLAVHNEGKAIPEEEQARVFQPFQRIRSAVAQGAAGWGLGLTLVRGMAEAHGGTVRLESSKAGTTFTVTLRQG